MNYEFFYGLTFNPFTKGLPAHGIKNKRTYFCLYCSAQ